MAMSIEFMTATRMRDPFSQVLYKLDALIQRYEHVEIHQEEIPTLTDVSFSPEEKIAAEKAQLVRELTALKEELKLALSVQVQMQLETLIRDQVDSQLVRLADQVVERVRPQVETVVPHLVDTQVQQLNTKLDALINRLP